MHPDAHNNERRPSSPTVGPEDRVDAIDPVDTFEPVDTVTPVHLVKPQPSTHGGPTKVLVATGGDPWFGRGAASLPLAARVSTIAAHRRRSARAAS